MYASVAPLFSPSFEPRFRAVLPTPETVVSPYAVHVFDERRIAVRGEDDAFRHPLHASSRHAPAARHVASKPIARAPVTGWIVETAPRIIDVNDAIASRHGGVLLAV